MKKVLKSVLYAALAAGQGAATMVVYVSCENPEFIMSTTAAVTLFCFGKILMIATNNLGNTR